MPSFNLAEGVPQQEVIPMLVAAAATIPKTKFVFFIFVENVYL
jgi:hypothetical protein